MYEALGGASATSLIFITTLWWPSNRCRIAKLPVGKPRPHRIESAILDSLDCNTNVASRGNEIRAVEAVTQLRANNLRFWEDIVASLHGSPFDSTVSCEQDRRCNRHTKPVSEEEVFDVNTPASIIIIRGSPTIPNLTCPTSSSVAATTDEDPVMNALALCGKHRNSPWWSI